MDGDDYESNAAVSQKPTSDVRSVSESVITDRYITYGKVNQKTQVYKKFDASPFKNLFNIERMQSVGVKDAMVDAH